MIAPMKTTFPKIRAGLAVPLTWPERKVLGFLCLLTLLGALVLFLKAFMGGDPPLWIQPGKKDVVRNPPAQAFHEYASKSTPALNSVDLNRADEKELTRVPRVGKVMARRILEYRGRTGPFRNISQLRNVPGIGEKRFKQVERYFFVVGGPTGGK